MLCDILWSDPDSKIVGWQPNDRGVSYVFGTDILNQFLQKMDLDIVVRLIFLYFFIIIIFKKILKKVATKTKFKIIFINIYN